VYSVSMVCTCSAGVVRAVVGVGVHTHTHQHTVGSMPALRLLSNRGEKSYLCSSSSSSSSVCVCVVVCVW
jgi:hypothetical protein